MDGALLTRFPALSLKLPLFLLPSVLISVLTDSSSVNTLLNERLPGPDEARLSGPGKSLLMDPAPAA